MTAGRVRIPSAVVRGVIAAALSLLVVAIALVVYVALAWFAWATKDDDRRSNAYRDDPVDLPPPPLSAAELAVSRETRGGP